MEQYLSEIRLMSFEIVPRGWAVCDGSLLPIVRNQPLYSLLGTAYGGDGKETFGIPDLRGRVPIGAGNGYVRGQSGGEAAHTLTIGEMPSHFHPMLAAPQAGNQVPDPAGHVLGPAGNVYAPPPPNATLHPASVGDTGGSEAHPNMQPYLTLSYCIALQGIFPSPS